MPVGRPGRPGGRRFILIRAIERNGRGVLMQPGRGDDIDLERFESDGTKDTVEIRGKQRIEDVPSTVIVERGAR